MKFIRNIWILKMHLIYREYMNSVDSILYSLYNVYCAAYSVYYCKFTDIIKVIDLRIQETDIRGHGYFYYF